MDHAVYVIHILTGSVKTKIVKNKRKERQLNVSFSNSESLLKKVDIDQVSVINICIIQTKIRASKLLIENRDSSIRLIAPQSKYLTEKTYYQVNLSISNLLTAFQRSI
jgi:hypothetical protein